MRRILLIVVFAFVVGSGAVVTVAQSGTGNQEAAEAGASAGCATPDASPFASAVASPASSPVSSKSLDTLATAVASPMETEACATPEVGTPAS
jgi:hypothetical protein